MSYTEPGYPHLSYSQLEEVWIQAGGNPKLAPLMAAIAEAESGGWAGATNPTDNSGRQTSWGLWQISNGTHGSPAPSGQDIYEPIVNARAAVEKLKSQGLGAWGTYTSGAYQTYLKGGVPPGTGTLPVGSGVGGRPGSGFAENPFLISPHAFDVGGFLVNPVGSVISDIAGSSGLGGLVKDIPGVKNITDAMKAISEAVNVIANVFAAFLWLLNPSHILRVVSGLLGMIILASAIYLVATT